MPSSFSIGGRGVGAGHPCYIIAEIGSNHNQDLAQAYRLIDAAADAGANAVKFQTFRASQHYSRYAPGFTYLFGQSTYELIASLEIDRSWHAPLQAHAAARGIDFFSSPCDSDAIEELQDLDVPAYKLASFDLPDLELVRQMASCGKPIILSTGMADMADVRRAMDACRSSGNDRIALLQCTSLYPAPASLANLRALDTLRQVFGCVVGYSDHTVGDQVALAAVALGASILEKHFTLDRALPGPDHPFATNPAELKDLVRRVRDVESALGDGLKAGPRSEELEMYTKGRRSLHSRVAIPRGTVITSDMLSTKRPGFGISPHLRETVIGRRARADIAADHWITEDMLE